MVTRNQANSIADAVLAQERARSAARLNRRYRSFPELDSVEPEHRAQVLRAANRAVTRNCLLHLAALSWVAAYALTWGFLVPQSDKHSAVAVFALGATVPIPFFYGACVRRQVRRIARSMVASSGAIALDKP
jgi:hypothetical protein